MATAELICSMFIVNSTVVNSIDSFGATPPNTTLQLMTTNMAAYPDSLIGDPAVTEKPKLLPKTSKQLLFHYTARSKFSIAEITIHSRPVKTGGEPNPRLFTSRSAISVTLLV